MIPQKRQTIKDIIAALDSGHLLFGDSVRFIDTFYTSYFASRCPLPLREGAKFAAPDL